MDARVRTAFSSEQRCGEMRVDDEVWQAALGYMEELVTANREKVEANAARDKVLEEVARLTAKHAALEVCSMCWWCIGIQEAGAGSGRQSWTYNGGTTGYNSATGRSLHSGALV